MRFDSAQQLTPPVAKWLDAVLGAPVHGWPHPERRALDEKVLGCDMRTAARPGMEGRENFLRWGGPLPPNLEAIHQVAALWPTYRRCAGSDLHEPTEDYGGLRAMMTIIPKEEAGQPTGFKFMGTSSYDKRGKSKQHEAITHKPHRELLQAPCKFLVQQVHRVKKQVSRCARRS